LGTRGMQSSLQIAGGEGKRGRKRSLADEIRTKNPPYVGETARLKFPEKEGKEELVRFFAIHRGVA